MPASTRASPRALLCHVCGTPLDLAIREGSNELFEVRAAKPLAQWVCPNGACPGDAYGEAKSS